MNDRQRRLLLNCAVALCIAAAVSFLSHRELIQRLALNGFDFSFRLRGPVPCNDRIIIIEVSDDEIARVGRWPWSRDWHAALSTALTDLGAKIVFFDFVLSEPSNEEDDAVLEQALQKNGNVYLPEVLYPAPSSGTPLLPLPRFARYMKGTGSITIVPDIDGIVRKSRIIFRKEDGGFEPSIALRIAMDYRGQKLGAVTADGVELEGGDGSVCLVPFAEKDTMFIDWLGEWKHTFRHFGYLQVLDAYRSARAGEAPCIPVEAFKGSICLVGSTATGLLDIKPTPLEPEYPGIGITATVINDILDGRFLRPVRPWLNTAILFLLCAIPALLMKGTRPLEEIFLAVFVGLAYGAVNFYFFKQGIVLSLASPLIGLLATYIVLWSANFFRISRERQHFFKMSVTDSLTGIYNIRYFRLLLDSELMLAKPKGGSMFCVVMVDIDLFKQFNDTYGHLAGDFVLREVARTLRATVRSSDIVARYGGEEMIILLRGASFREGVAVMEKMRQNVENAKIRDEKRSYSVKISAGLAAYRDGDTAETIIARADAGLYRAKSQGRNRCCAVED